MLNNIIIYFTLIYIYTCIMKRHYIFDFIISYCQNINNNYYLSIS